MEWAFIFKVISCTFLFLAVEALVVHIYIRIHGDNWGKQLLKVLMTSYITTIIFSAMVGSVAYVLLSGFKCSLLR
jgi:hypothetical protein